MKLTIDKLLELLPDFRLDHRGKNLTGPCPACGYAEFGISIEEGHRFGCYRKVKCGFTGNIYTLLKYLGKYDFIVAERASKLIGKIENKQLISNIDLTVANVPKPLGWRRIYDSPYLRGRGFSLQDFENYEVGSTLLDPRLKNDYVIFTVKENDEVKGWVARYVKSKEEIDAINKRYERAGVVKKVRRFINSFSDFAKLAYGIDEIKPGATKTIIAVEGIMDKIGIDRLLNLHSQDYMKCNATFKCNVSDEQIAKWQIRGIENIILLYDPDVIKTIKANIKRLEQFFNVLVGYSISGRDPGDMIDSDIEYVMEHLEDPIQFHVNKLEVPKLKF